MSYNWQTLEGTSQAKVQVGTLLTVCHGTVCALVCTAIARHFGAGDIAKTPGRR